MDPARRGDDSHLDRHPDLAALGRRLRSEMDDTLRAEQHAARVSAQRRSTIRDRFLLAADRGESLRVDVVDGLAFTGLVLAVGADHVVMTHEDRQVWIAMQHVVATRSAS